MELGASGLESDAWATSDGFAVLDHDGVVRAGLRRRPISAVTRTNLPDHIPTLEELFSACPTGFELSLDVKDPASIDAVMEALAAISNAVGRDVAPSTWLCHPDFEVVAGWKLRWPEVRVVHSTRLTRLRGLPERHAAELAAAGIDAINMRAPDWTGGLTTLFHRFGVYCFGWDAQLDRTLAELIDAGLDGVYSNHVDRMMAAISAAQK